MAKPVGGVHITMSASAAKFEADMKRARDAAKKSGDGFKKSFGQGKRATDSLTKSLGSLKGVIAGGLGVAAIVNFGKSAVKSFAEFEGAMTATNTILNLTKDDLAKLSDEARSAAVAVGETPQGFATAMYQAVSAGVALEDVIGTVSVATKLAKAGYTTTANSVDLLTTVMNAYGDAVGDVTAVSDILLVTQNRGKTTIDQLAQSLGNLIPIAAALKVDFEVLSGAMATLTAAGIGTAEATTALRALLNALSAPTNQQLQLWDKLGIEWNQARLGGDGLIGIIKELNEKTGGQTKLLTELGINQRALNGILSLGGDRINEFAEGVEAARSATGTLAKSYSQTVDTMKGATDRLKSSIEDLKIELVVGFGPELTTFISRLAATIPLLKESSSVSDSYATRLKALIDGLAGTGKAGAEVDRVLKALTATTKEASEAGLKEIVKNGFNAKNTFDEIVTAIKGYFVAMDGFDATTQEIKDFVKAELELLNIIKRNTIVADNFSDAVDQWGESLNNVDSKTARKDIDDLIESGFKAEFIFERIATSVNNYTDSMQGFTATKSDVDTYVKTLLKMLQSNKDLKTSTDVLVKGAQDYAVSLTEIARDAGIANDELQKLKDHQLARSGMSAEAIVPDMSVITESLKDRLTREFEINKAAIIERNTMVEGLTKSQLMKIDAIEMEALVKRLSDSGKITADGLEKLEAINIAHQSALDNIDSEGMRSRATKAYEIRKASIISQNTIAGKLSAVGLSQLEDLEKEHQEKISSLSDDKIKERLDRELNTAKIAILELFATEGKLTQDGLAKLKALQLQYQSEIAEGEADNLKSRLAKEAEFWNAKAVMAKQYVDVIAEIGNNIVAAQNGRIETELQNDIEGEQAKYEARKTAAMEQAAMETGLTAQHVQNLSSIELSALISKLTTEGRLTETSLKKLDDLEIAHAAVVSNLEANAEREKIANAKKLRLIKIAQAISNTAVAFTEALPNVVLAALVAAAGATQVAAIRAQPFAKGGVVGEETFFQMPRGKVGVMAEGDKAEAIMPLTRVGGDLGVKVELPESGSRPSLTMNLVFNGNITDKKYIHDFIVPAIETASRKGLNRLAIK